MKRPIHFIFQLFLFVVLGTNLYGQNYISYSRSVNRAESFVLQAKYNEAIEIYDSVLMPMIFVLLKIILLHFKLLVLRMILLKLLIILKDVFVQGLTKNTCSMIWSQRKYAQMVLWMNIWILMVHYPFSTIILSIKNTGGKWLN